MATYGKNQREENSRGCMKPLFYVYLIIMIVCGVGCLCVGLWMNADPYVKSYFTVLRRSVTDNALLSASILVLTCGFIIIGVAVLGCCGIRRKNRGLLTLFGVAIFLIIILELTAGFMIVVFKEDIHRSLKGGMAKSIKDEYLFANDVGRAWNFVQVREKCCGADGAADYDQSRWQQKAQAEENEKTGPGQRIEWYVPISCCVLQVDQDRDPSRVDPQNPRPRNNRHCQEAAQGRRTDGNNLHARGCFARLLDFIHMHINTLIGIGLAIGIFQIIGLALGCILSRTVKDRDQ